jgi:hypothetical protein
LYQVKWQDILNITFLNKIRRPPARPRRTPGIAPATTPRHRRFAKDRPVPPPDTHTQVRTRDRFDQFQAADELYRRVFGYDRPEFALNPNPLSALTRNGGSTIGAYTDSDRRVGVAYGFAGLDSADQGRPVTAVGIPAGYGGRWLALPETSDDRPDTPANTRTLAAIRAVVKDGPILVSCHRTQSATGPAGPVPGAATGTAAYPAVRAP